MLAIKFIQNPKCRQYLAFIIELHFHCNENENENVG